METNNFEKCQKEIIRSVSENYGVEIGRVTIDLSMDKSLCVSASKTQIEIIREKCENLGLNIYDVLREAKVPQTTVQNWKEDPKAFKTLAKINTAIEVLSKKYDV